MDLHLLRLYTLTLKPKTTEVNILCWNLFNWRQARCALLLALDAWEHRTGAGSSSALLAWEAIIREPSAHRGCLLTNRISSEPRAGRRGC